MNQTTKGVGTANCRTIPLFKDKEEYNAWGDKLMLIYENIKEKNGSVHG